MSSATDTRVVEMQFDNKDFERNVQTSVKTLDKLKASLNLDESAKSLSNLEKAGKNFSLESMSSSLDDLNSRFSTMGIVGINVLNRITDTAINGAKKIANVLVFDNIKSGFQEYETQIDAIQTILANTSAEMDKLGYTQQERIDLVNEKLDELNHYADKTIYNFTQMTANIGRFTAAGVGLETSVTAIQGIANLAAVSGSTSQQASTAMYQLSQALAAGSLKLQDWNSVVNAGMGGKIFQDELTRTARAMGITVDKTITETVETVNSKGKKVTKKVKKTVKKTVDELIRDAGSFRESLSDGWITADVLTEALSHFSWDFEELAKNSRKSEEEIEALRKSLMEKGYSLEYVNELLEQSTNLTVEQAKNLKKAELIAKGYTADEADEIIKMAEAATEAATKVKTFTQLIDTLKEALQSGWTQTWEYIIGDFEEAKELLTSISDHFGKLIDDSSNSRNAIVKDWKDLGGRNDLIDGMWNIINGIENIFKTVKGAFQEVFPPTTGQQLKDASVKFKEFTEGFKNLTENADKMETVKSVFKGFATVIDVVKSGLSWVLGRLVSLGKRTKGLWSGFGKYAGKLGDFIASLRNNPAVSAFLNDINEKLGAIAGKISEVFGSVSEKAYKKVSELYQKAKNLGIFQSIGKHISDFIGKIPDAIDWIVGLTKSVYNMVCNSKALNTVLSGFQSFFSAITELFNRGDDKIANPKEDGKNNSIVSKIASRYDGIIAALKQWFENAKTDAANALDDVKAFFGKLLDEDIPSFFAFIGDRFRKTVDTIVSIDWLGVINTAFSIYRGFKMLQLIDGFANIASGVKNIGKGFRGIGEGLEEIGTGIKNISKKGLNIIHKEKDSIGTTLLKIAASIGVIVAAMYVLAKMSPEETLKGLGLITLIGIELLTFSAIFKAIDVDGKDFLMLAGAITLLVISIKILARMDTEDAWNGILRIGMILGELALFTKLMGDGNKNKIAFLGIGVAVNLLVLAVKNLATLDPSELRKGLGGLGVLLLELALFIQSAGGKDKVSGLIGIAVAIGVMTLAMKKIGKMSWGQITKGLLGIGAMVVMFKALIKSTKGLTAANSLAALLLMAGTMLAFLFAFDKAQDMNIDDMLKFSAALGVVILAFAASMKIISTIPLKGAVTGSLGAVAAFAILIVGIGAVMAVLGALNNLWPNAAELIKSGGDILEAIGYSIGKFIGGISNGKAGDASNLEEKGKSLADFGTTLSDLSENMKPFFDNVAGIKEEAFTGAKNFAAVMTGIAWSEVVLGLASLFGEDPITKYLTDVSKLGTGLQGFATSIAGFKASSSKDAQAAIDTGLSLIGLMDKVPWDPNKLEKWLFGFKDVEQFKTNIGYLADGLKDFGTKINGLGNNVTKKAVDNALVAADGIATLLDSVHDTKIPDLSDFIEKLPELGSALKSYAENLGGFDNTVTKADVKNSTNAAMGVVGIIKALPNTGGALQNFTGFPNLSKFNEELPNFATAMIKYARTISRWGKTVVDKQHVTNSMLAANGIVDLINKLPLMDGILQNYTGFPDFQGFIESLPGFSAAMIAYAAEINKWDTTVSQSNIDNSLATANAIVALIDTLNRSDGWWQDIIGEKDLGKFSANVSAVGSALASFAADITSVNEDDTTKAVNVLEAIQAFTNKLDETGGVWDNIGKWFGGDKSKTLLEYTGNMKTLGLDLKTFSSSINKVKVSDVTYASTIFDAIVDFIGGLGDLKSANTSTMKKMVDIAGKMGSFGTGIGTFATGIQNARKSIADFESVKELIGTFMEYAKTVEKWSTEDGRDFETNYSNMVSMLDVVAAYGTAFNGFYNGIRDIDTDKVALMAETVRTFVSAAAMAHGLKAEDVTSVQVLLSSFSNIVIPVFDQEGASAAEAYITSLSTGIQNGINAITSAAGIASEFGADGAGDTYGVWLQTGVNLAAGMEQGILSMVGKIKSAAIAAASGAVRAIQITWQVHSPSKVGEGLGMNYDRGIANGISKYSTLVSGEAADMGKSVIESAKTLLRGPNLSIFDFIDPNPTIRPVIDLSGVEDGTRLISGMFAANQIIGGGLFSGRTFAVGAGALNFEGSRIVGTQDNADVVNELQELRNHVDALNETIYNMQIVLDSGALVGGTSSKMDAELGNRAMMKARAN